MSCRCSKPRDTEDYREGMGKALETVDFRDIFEHGDAGMCQTAASALRHLTKAERAERLGLAEDVATLYRQAAERDNAQTLRQVRTVIERLDERTGRDDWNDLVERARDEFDQRDGRTVVEESRGRLRLALFEMDDVTAEQAGAIVAIADVALEQAVEDGLNGAAKLLRETLLMGIQAFQSPEMGRQATVRKDSTANVLGITVPPLTDAQIVCISWVVAGAAVALLGCMFIPFCWCCLTPVIAAVTAQLVFNCIFFGCALC